MKTITFLFFILPILSFSQWTQVGGDIDGLNNYEESGRSVSLSSDGNTVAIGVFQHDSQKGTTRIYTNSGGTWTQVGSDIDGVDAYEWSGTAVSLSGDGNTVAIGANRHDSQKGTTRIYTYSGGTWTQVGSDIDGEDTGERSGRSISLSNDGNMVAVGAYEHDFEKGTTRIYTNSGGAWIQVGNDIDGEDYGEWSGWSVSLSNDGNTVAVGATEHDGYKGTTRIYTNSGGTWTQIGSDIDGEEASERSGASVSLNDDGGTVAIGAHFHDSAKGTTRIYTYSGGTWTQVGSDIDGVETNEQFGGSVSLSSDGGVVGIGAFRHDSLKGTTRIYAYNGSTWTQVGSDVDGEGTSDYSGLSVSLSENGGIIAIGAVNHDVFKGTTRIYTNSILSIKENTFGDSFSVFPNPSFGVTKIRLGNSYDSVNVRVLDILGSQVFSQEYNSTNEVKLDTNNFNSGIYFIKVNSKAKEATIKLMVK